MKKIVLAFLLAAFGGVAYLLVYLGYFKPVTVNEEDNRAFRFLAKAHMGAYHKIVPVIQEVEKWAKENGLDCRFTFGLYHDDPENVEESRLRSHGGCVLNEGEEPGVLPAEFEIIEQPASSYVTAIFEGSPAIGPFRVYPRLIQYVEEKQYTRPDWGVIEIYEVHASDRMTTTYYFPVIK